MTEIFNGWFKTVWYNKKLTIDRPNGQVYYLHKRKSQGRNFERAVEVKI